MCCNQLGRERPFLCGAGVTDHLAESEPHAISIARNILGNLNMAAAAGTSSSSPFQLADATAQGGQAGSLPAPAPAWEEPLFPAEELRGNDQNYVLPAACCCIEELSGDDQ